MSNTIEQELCNNLGIVQKTVYISQCYKDPITNDLYLIEIDHNKCLKNKYVIRNSTGVYKSGFYEITYFPEDTLTYNAICLQSIQFKQKT